MIGAILCGLYGAYYIVLQRDTACTTFYIKTGDSVQCGSANSLQYEKIEVGGDFKTGDDFIGRVEASVVKPKELFFYAVTQTPFSKPQNVSRNQCILLEGLGSYLMTGSIIYGNCCITNNGNTQITVNLHIFINQEDTCHSDQGAENSILTENIEIPKNEKRCFKKWGNNTPFTVEVNSYYYFQVNLPGNTTIFPNVMLYRRFVNASDYDKPHYFNYDTGTDFSLSHKPFSTEKYIVICKLLQSNAYHLTHLSSVKSAYNIVTEHAHQSKLQQGTLHLNSCKKSYPGRKKWSKVILSFGIIFLIISLILCPYAFFFVICYFYVKKKHPFFNQFRPFRRIN